MHFSLVFNSHESADLTYSLLFVPCPVWQKGDREIINLHCENPTYQRGDLQALLKLEPVLSGLASGPRQAAIVIHNSGHGTTQDLSALQADLIEEGFALNMVSFIPSR